MYVVYEPKGRALEYSELACNLYMGCPHGCKYCFAPGCMRKTAVQWHSSTTPRKNVISLLEKDAKTMWKKDSRKILFSFLSDPYQPMEREEHLTRQALEIVYRYGLKSQVLTKGVAELISEDMPLMKSAGTELGITLCFTDDNLRQIWEPEAASVNDRMAVVREAHRLGIYTWISLEPVLDPQQALEVIEMLHPYVNFWKVGKLNHMKEVEATIDWYQFRQDAESLLQKCGASYYLKEDLRKAKKR